MSTELVLTPGTGFVAELRRRSPTLTSFGIACLLAGAVTLCLPLVDARQFGGAPVWLKPTKFFLSFGLFALTSAWFIGYVRPERRMARPLRVATLMLVAAGSFELGYITLQAGQGQASHFNVGDPIHGLLYALMGVGALTLLASKIPLAIEIAGNPVTGLPPALRLALVLGLCITIVFGGAGGILISLNHGTVIGPVGPRLPVFGWNLGGGDLRIGHFLGMHAEQVLPLAALAIEALRFSFQRSLVVGTALFWAGLSILAILQARAGLAFPFG
ncbi:MAG: hypothetical protein K2Y56_00905 [Methylobacterium sp.]|uniref:hypothetical protein n=1 Tax=Methylobacterium sp. TaxID=409 RepID=UPI0025D0D066|nr:hypothetical protein [Methylobacterium sp.]MBX9930097.1 hypothetical protein [Methylobacterium sp.]